MKKFLNKKLYVIILTIMVSFILIVFFIVKNSNPLNEDILINENINQKNNNIEYNDSNIDNITENTIKDQYNIVSQGNTNDESKIIENQKPKSNENKGTSASNNKEILEKENKKQELSSTTNKVSESQHSNTNSAIKNNQQTSKSNSENNQPNTKNNNSSDSKNNTEDQLEKCKRGQHLMEVGNCGKWFNSHSECEAYYDKIVKEWNDKFNNGKITYDEYLNKCPTSFEDFSCMCCGKYTMNIYYRK